MGGPTRVDYAGAACKMRGKHERNHKFVVALPRAQAFDRRRQFGRGTTRNHPEPPRNHPKSAAEPPRNHPGTTAEPIRNPARPNPIGTCGASICLNWHWLVTGSRCPTPRVCLCFSRRRANNPPYLAHWSRKESTLRATNGVTFRSRQNSSASQMLRRSWPLTPWARRDIAGPSMSTLSNQCATSLTLHADIGGG